MDSFGVTWDYRCPFARNAHEHLVLALADGAPWPVRFLPFSLDQAHVEDGQAPVWDDPAKAPALLAGQVALAVRDGHPGSFLALHGALFRARHEEGRDIRDQAVLRQVLEEQGLPGDAILAEVAGGGPLATFRSEHEAVVAGHSCFGVPTFVAGDQAVFVRLMNRPEGDAALARRTIERVLDLMESWPELNELKHTTISR